MDCPIFETKRLRVYYNACQPNDGASVKDTYIAFFNEYDGWVGVVATLVVDPRCGEFPAIVEWIEVSSEWRRKGIATELVKGVEQWLNIELEAEGVTPEGIAFVESMCHD